MRDLRRLVLSLAGATLVSATIACSGGHASGGNPSTPASVQPTAVPTNVESVSPPREEPQPTGVVLPPPTMIAVHFIDTQRGWAIQISATNSGERYILHTSDGGASWSELARLDYHIDTIDFVDDDHGWVATSASNRGVTLSTNDGGTTWSSNPALLGAGMLDFLSPFVGWAEGFEQEPLKTTDGGATWTVAAAPCPADQYSSTLVSFSDPFNGLLACRAKNGGAGFQGKLLYRTTDGGTHWAEIPNSLQPGGYLSGLQSLDSSHAWYATDYPAATLFSSTDEGASWTPSALPGGRGYFAKLGSVDFVDPLHGWVVAARDAGGPGVLLATVDGGASWRGIDMKTERQTD